MELNLTTSDKPNGDRVILSLDSREALTIFAALHSYKQSLKEDLGSNKFLGYEDQGFLLDELGALHRLVASMNYQAAELSDPEQELLGKYFSFDMLLQFEGSTTIPTSTETEQTTAPVVPDQQGERLTVIIGHMPPF